MLYKDKLDVYHIVTTITEDDSDLTLCGLKITDMTENPPGKVILRTNRCHECDTLYANKFKVSGSCQDPKIKPIEDDEVEEVPFVMIDEDEAEIDPMVVSHEDEIQDLLTEINDQGSEIDAIQQELQTVKFGIVFLLVAMVFVGFSLIVVAARIG